MLNGRDERIKVFDAQTSFLSGARRVIRSQTSICDQCFCGAQLLNVRFVRVRVAGNSEALVRARLCATHAI